MASRAARGQHGSWGVSTGAASRPGGVARGPGRGFCSGALHSHTRAPAARTGTRCIRGHAQAPTARWAPIGASPRCWIAKRPRSSDLASSPRPGAGAGGPNTCARPQSIAASMTRRPYDSTPFRLHARSDIPPELGRARRVSPKHHWQSLRYAGSDRWLSATHSANGATANAGETAYPRSATADPGTAAPGRNAGAMPWRR